LVVLLRNYVTMMHGQQNIKNGWATIVVVGRLRVKERFIVVILMTRQICLFNFTEQSYLLLSQTF
jgi:hypothetical protein